MRKRPITLGHEVAGNVISIGPGVTEAIVGDSIFVSLGGNPDRPPKVIGLTMNKGNAEYAVAAAEMLVHMPDGVSYEQAGVLTDSHTMLSLVLVKLNPVTPLQSLAWADLDQQL